MRSGAAWPIVERFVDAAVLLVAFLLVELVQKRPMVDFTLFAQSTFLGSAFAMLGYAGGAQVMIFYLPLFLQNAFDLSPAMTGLAMLPFALPMFLTPRLGAGASLFPAHLADRRINDDRDRQPAAVGARALLLALSCIPSRHAGLSLPTDTEREVGFSRVFASQSAVLDG